MTASPWDKSKDHMSRAMSRATRLQRIEELLLNAHGGHTVRELADKLDVHRTTIWRDLNEVSRYAPVQQIEDRYFIDRADYLSSVRLTREESLMLYLAMRRIMHRPTDVPPMMLTAMEKLLLVLRDPTAGQLADSLETMQVAQPSDTEHAHVWETLVRAWMERITVRITYQETEEEVIEVQPYLFEPALVGEGLYVIGHSLTHNTLQAFKVERISRAALTTDRFARPENIVVDAILRQVWGIWYGEELIEVKLRFRDPEVASQIRDTLWLPSQKTHDLPDGGVEWSVRAADVVGLVPWIRSWGSACEVLSPPELREHIEEIEQSIGDIAMTVRETPQTLSASDVFLSSLLEMEDGNRFKMCLSCTNCSGICPFGYLMDYPPRKLLASIRAGMLDAILDSDTIWMCVSCYACSEVCAAEIPLTEGLMTLIKEEMVLNGNIPNELQDAFENTQRYGNPMGESPRRRADWARGLEPEVKFMRTAERPVDVLWFVGDYASYHPRVQQISRALARVLAALGVDFGILGPEEQSDGDSQRLAGERGLFETLVEKNGQIFEKYEFNQIITTDPHAYNAFRNEYPALSIAYPVQHYTQFLFDRLDQLQPLLRRDLNATITYHDPCYLGRANGEYEAPRALLKAIPGVELTEMSHARETSLCCGGGGGGMWLDGFQWAKANTRLSEWRVREAVDASGAGHRADFVSAPPTKREREKRRNRETQRPPEGPREIQVLAVACPYEAPRFEDAAKMVKGAERLLVRDIAELLAEAIGDEE